ncbi:MAG: sensor histidine kinase [Acidobacteria bacterium]|nr:sensor histidine kinase [Acidobacteriota bacterium]
MPPSPTPRLLLALAVTLAAVGAFSAYSLRQIEGLRRLQSETVERNRRDSLQLLRIQNNLNSLALALRDMQENEEGYPLTAWAAELRRMRFDLEDALRIESRLAVRSREQNEYLENAVAQFWRSVGQVLSISAGGDEARARRMASNTLQAQQAALTATVARLLVQNNEAEEAAAAEIARIYGRVERNTYFLLAALLAGILAASLAVIYFNRRVFNQLAAASRQRSTLARKLISLQEDVLRSIARELHDDFGQILTAIGAMLQRADKKHLPAGSPLRAELAEVGGIVQGALEKTRGLSQTLHPTVLDDYGFEKALERFLPVFEKQTGIHVQFEKSGEGRVPDQAAIHLYRVLQEALNNIARHARTSSASVRLRFLDSRLALEIEDHGAGMPPRGNNRGLGLVAMRERAELLHGSLSIEQPREGGTRVLLEVPLEQT